MHYIRKSVAVLLLAVLFALLPLSSSTLAAGPRMIYTDSTTQTITQGATLEDITRFTDSGWLSIHVLRLDLSNQYLKVDTVTNTSTDKTLTTTQALAQSNGAVAAVNGGYFGWLSESGTGEAYGTLVQGGTVIGASNTNGQQASTMATMALDKLNQPIFGYWKTDIKLIAPNGTAIPTARYNKPFRKEYKDLTVLDSKWTKSSPGAAADCPDTVEMVVVEGKVVQIRQGLPSVQIPANGYVVVTRQESSQPLLDNFKEGDPVALDISTSPDWPSLNMAITGGAILLKDGQMPSKFTLDSPGRNPRTLAGSTQDGKQLILVTVDGRQQGSIGMTLPEAADLMKELGAHHALNMDGGGSATMVARKPGTTQLEVVNTPSEGSQRKVPTGIGVFSIAPTSGLSGLIIDTENKNVFVNTSRGYSVRGFDRYFNPVAVKPDQVKWSVTGVKGTFKNGIFYPTSVGSGKIIAAVGTVKAEQEINVLSAPVELALEYRTRGVYIGNSANFTLTGKNINGYYADINPADASWAVGGEIGTISKGVFKATAPGTGYVDAYIGKVHAYCGISVSSEKAVVQDGFEASNGTSLTYPAQVTASYAISTEQKHSGKFSGKLTYDFSDLSISGSRAAYFLPNSEGIKLSAGTTSIGVWVYCPTPNPNWLRMEVTDAKGVKRNLDLSKEMNWTGWKYVSAYIGNLARPAVLNRIYLVQTEKVADTGYIYLDDLTVTELQNPTIDMNKLPKNTVPVDGAYKAISKYVPTSTSFRFSIYGESREPKNPLENLLAKQLGVKINKYLDAAAFVGSTIHKSAASVTKPAIVTNTGYKSFDIKNSRFIQLDMSKNGLRASNTQQWHWLLQQLDSFKGSNLFLFMAKAPGTFSDKLEAGLFQQILTQYKQKTGKNVWVFYQGSGNSSYMERGIRYISTMGAEVPGLTADKTAEAKYVLVTVNGNTPTFEFKSVTP